MNKTRIGYIFQIAAMLAVALAMIPRLQLFYFENGHWLERSYEQATNWNYLMMRSWCVIIAGVLIGAILFWIGSSIKIKRAKSESMASPHFSAVRLLIILCILVIIALLAYNLTKLPGVVNKLNLVNESDKPTVAALPAHLTPIEAQSNALAKINHINVRVRPSEFSDQQKTTFSDNFFKKYKPAVSNWCNAYQGHLPFSLNDLTPDKLAERLGRSESFYNYTFVLNGITLCVTDENGVASVFYVNAPQSQDLMGKPDGSPPTSIIPISKSEIRQMLQADSGIAFTDAEIRLTPTGYSSALNGGMYANVGGDPNNAATWKYTLVFDPAGKMAYYIRGR